jgi:hypothetical protein
MHFSVDKRVDHGVLCWVVWSGYAGHADSVMMACLVTTAALSIRTATARQLISGVVLMRLPLPAGSGQQGRIPVPHMRTQCGCCSGRNKVRDPPS